MEEGRGGVCAVRGDRRLTSRDRRWDERASRREGERTRGV